MRRSGWAALIIATAALALVARPASAHNTLVSTDPAEGSTPGAVPAAIVLTFDEPAVAMGTQIVITGPTGPVQTGSPRLVDDTVTQEIAAASPAGAYTVQWRVTSADGHPITGTFGFTAAAAGGGSSAVSASPEPVPVPMTPAGPPVRPLVLGLLAGLALIAAVVLVLRRMGRRR